MTLLLAGLLLGVAFGASARLGRLCLLRGLKGWRATRADSKGSDADEGHALRAFALALAVALALTQALAMAGQIDLAQAQVVRAKFAWPAVFVGGALFGVGMVMARSCGARALVLLGGGNLRALPVLLCLALAAQATLTGVLAPVRDALQGFGRVELAQATLPAWLVWAGLPSSAAWLLAVGLPVLALLFFALRRSALRRAALEAAMAAIVGALVATGWWITAHVGVDLFEPAPLTSLSFIGPLAESTLFLQLAVGRAAGVGAAVVAGTLLGAFAVALATRTWRLEAFDEPRRMALAMTGGLLMGFGGVLAVGCSIGQGLSGLSTLAIASLPACAGIVIGALAALAVQDRLNPHPDSFPEFNTGEA